MRRYVTLIQSTKMMHCNIGRFGLFDDAHSVTSIGQVLTVRNCIYVIHIIETIIIEMRKYVTNYAPDAL